MRGLAAEHLVADLALRILHQDAALGALHEDDEGDDRHHDRASRNDDQKVDSAPVRPSSRSAASAAGHARDDAGEDDERDAVADAARGDLLAEPHQEDVPPVSVTTVVMRKKSRVDATTGPCGRAGLEPDGDAVGLHRGQQHRAVDACTG